MVVISKVPNPSEDCSFRFANSRRELRQITFEKSDAIYSRPFGLVHITPRLNAGTQRDSWYCYKAVGPVHSGECCQISQGAVGRRNAHGRMLVRHFDRTRSKAR
jgi:hypothetical protein